MGKDLAKKWQRFTKQKDHYLDDKTREILADTLEGFVLHMKDWFSQNYHYNWTEFFKLPKEKRLSLFSA